MKARLLALLMPLMTVVAIQADEPWKLNLDNKEEQVTLKLNLHEETIDVPGMDIFGPMNGYMAGKGVYGTWRVTSFTIKDDHTATLRLSNDQGSETQSIRLTWKNDSTYLMELQDGVVVKRAVNKKLVKLPPRMELRLKP